VTGPDARESFRRVVEDLRTPEGERCTLIITGRGGGSQWRIWLTFAGGIRSTAVLTSRQAAAVVSALTEAPPPA
jgi:hypothetical protein